MMNKYGHFKYLDFAVGAKENVSYSINKDLQEGSALTQLSVGVKPYDFASVEHNAYITSEPKPLYKMQQDLGLITADVSDENGAFNEPIVLTANFSSFFSMTGITINSRNVIKEITISAYQNNTEISSETFSSSTKENFYPINIELANKIVFTITKINEPNHFFGIFNIEYGKIRIFDDNIGVDAEIATNFSVLGDTLEYDTLDLTLIDPEEEDYLFQRKQPIEFIIGNTTKSKFYVDSGTKLDDNTVQVLAYDGISSLEDDFLGGFYTNYRFNDLIHDIFEGTNVEYATSNTDDVFLNGYLPITSRRKAIQTVLEGSNIRCYKEGKLVFTQLQSEMSRDLIFDEKNIIDKPKKTKKQEIRSLTVKQHNYSKGTEFVEAYHWYISKTENVRITFSEPLHSLEVYEVVGVDENGSDIIDTEQSTNVVFIEKSANYCVVSNKSSNKIVIKGLNYVESTVNYEKLNPAISMNEIYEEKIVELTISENPEAVCDLLYQLYSRKNSITFKTFEDVNVGGCYSVLGEILNIKSKKQSMNGIYEVEAV